MNITDHNVTLDATSIPYNEIQMAMTAATTKRRISRHKKKCWRKRTADHGVVVALEEQRHEMQEGLKSDECLFSIDRKPEDEVLKLTRRQRAALQRRLRKKEQEDGTNLSKKVVTKSFPKKRHTFPVQQSHQVLSCAIDTSKVCDVWETKQEVQLPPIEEYYLRVTKQKQPNEPITLKHVTSVLPSVEVAEPGASYNPSVSQYMKYLKSIADEEQNREKEEKKLEEKLKLAKDEKLITRDEALAEESALLFDNEGRCTNDGESTDENASKSDADEKCYEGNSKIKSKPRKKKARRLESLQRTRQMKEKAEKNMMQEMNRVFSAKKLTKEIVAEEERRKQIIAARHKQKLIKKLTGKRQLGRGKFEPTEKSFLLKEELPGTLRQLIPQGNLLLERLKSMQQRNKLPIPGERRIGRKLKRKLKYKYVKERKHEEVTIGSRVI